MTPVETSRFVIHTGATMRLFEALYYQNRDGRLDDWLWRSVQLPFKQTITHPAFEAYWNARGDNFTEDLIRHYAVVGSQKFDLRSENVDGERNRL